ncbi:zinc finger protein 362a isoform X2 [Ictalurus punctatus]|uniref:Zinc finger protein 362a isoform X2 n=1 Tax=Ictalurus punctatus TaxID=7998 RepID=A0A2D0PL17_ICTPU|nr:zinc finger protein 362a isoform X2 [Ictalurus punctatus]
MITAFIGDFNSTVGDALFMAEPRFNNPYFWPPPPAMPGQLDNLVLINKIKEQLMAEKIRPPHLPPTSVQSQQPLLVPPTSSEGGTHSMAVSKLQQMPGLPHSPTQPDVALHARPASSSVAGRILGDVNLNLDDKAALKARGLWEDWHLRQIIDQPSRVNHLSGIALSSRTGNQNTSEAVTLGTPTSSSSSHARLGSAPSANLLSGLASAVGAEPIKHSGGLVGLLGPPPKSGGRGRKKIKAENASGPLLVVPYPILASGADQSSVTITAKEGKTYRCKVCPLTFFSKSDMQIHSKSHTEAKPHKCPHCTKSFANASYLAQHLRIHLGVKPYHCSYCEKSFRQLSHLQQHTRIHTGDRPYKCIQPGCDKAFTQLSNLQSHQRSHNKDKPYKCSHCYRAYSDSASLQIHLAAHAIKNAKAYCCSMCGRAYTSETYLMKHMSKHTVVEHLVTQHSPPRNESPSIPIRISLI